MKTCCCGCSILGGLVLLLVLNLIICFAVVICGFWKLVLLKSGVYDFNDWIWVTLIVVFLVGIPIIFGALHGVWTRTEGNAFMYFYYLVGCSLVWLGWVIYYLAICNTCETIGNIDAEFPSEEPQAFWCGIIRIICWLIVLLLVLLQCYFLWAVYSACDCLKSGSATPQLGDLLHGHDIVLLKRKSIRKPGKSGEGATIWWPCSWPPCTFVSRCVLKACNLDDPVAFEEEDDFGGLNNKNYAAFSQASLGPYPKEAYSSKDYKNLGQPNTLFGASQHEMRYPPNRDAH